MLSAVHPVALGAPKSFVDVRFDTSGQQLAVSSADGSVYIWPTDEEVLARQQNLQPTSVLKGHEGPVWTVDFAPTEFGPLCVTGGFDRRLIVWKDFGNGNWQMVFCDESHKSGVTSVKFCSAFGAPYSTYQLVAVPGNAPVGLYIASASLDGSVRIFSLTNDGTWVGKSFIAHMSGVTVVSWSTAESAAGAAATLDENSQLSPQHRLATGSIDGTVCIWRHDSGQNEWLKLSRISVGRPVVSLAWQPTNENPRDLMAILTDDGTISFWEKDERNEQWQDMHRFSRIAVGASKVSWSLDGLLLALPGVDTRVLMIRENPDRTWELCSTE